MLPVVTIGNGMQPSVKVVERWIWSKGRADYVDIAAFKKQKLVFVSVILHLIQLHLMEYGVAVEMASFW